MNPTEILIAARAKIADPNNWCRGVFARDAKSKSVKNAWDKDAVCWCAQGAVEYIVKKRLPWHDPVLKLLNEAADTNIIDYNDTHLHNVVLAIFDKAIELSKQPAPTE